ncbi:hypothetical protein F5146DRAFT_1002205 [Armillaria mellea]|nr:hypothetical protein F5146DRAFT_1002205 [Armillaria mellea]
MEYGITSSDRMHEELPQNSMECQSTITTIQTEDRAHIHRDSKFGFTTFKIIGDCNVLEHDVIGYFPDVGVNTADPRASRQPVGGAVRSSALISPRFTSNVDMQIQGLQADSGASLNQSILINMWTSCASLDFNCVGIKRHPRSRKEDFGGPAKFSVLISWPQMFISPSVAIESSTEGKDVIPYGKDFEGFESMSYGGSWVKIVAGKAE